MTGYLCKNGCDKMWSVLPVMLLLCIPSYVVFLLAENGEEPPEFSKNPWVLVAETVRQDFLSALQQLKDVIMDYSTGTIQPQLLKDVAPGCGIGRIKPYLVVRLGKVLFHGLVHFSLFCLFTMFNLMWQRCV